MNHKAYIDKQFASISTALENSPSNLGPETDLHGRTDSIATITSTREPAFIDWMSDKVALTVSAVNEAMRRGGGPLLRGDAAVNRMTTSIWRTCV